MAWRKGKHYAAWGKPKSKYTTKKRYFTGGRGKRKVSPGMGRFAPFRR